MKLTKQEFESMMVEFIDEQNSNDSEEYYGSDRSAARIVIERMINYFYEEEIAKEARYKQYLELKKEFE